MEEWLNWDTDEPPCLVCKCGTVLSCGELITRELTNGEWIEEPVRIIQCPRSRHPLSTDHSYAMRYRWYARLERDK